MAKRNASPHTEDQDVARGDLEQLMAYARNVGAPSLEELARKIAGHLGVEPREDEIEKRRK